MSKFAGPCPLVGARFSITFSPQGSAENKSSIELQDLTREEELQKTLDFLATQALLGGNDKGKVQIP
jgi:hypothetical protein